MYREQMSMIICGFCYSIGITGLSLQFHSDVGTLTTLSTAEVNLARFETQTILIWNLKAFNSLFEGLVLSLTVYFFIYIPAW